MGWLGENIIMTEQEETAKEIWQFMNPDEKIPLDKAELASAVKLVEEIDTMEINFKQKLEKLKRVKR